MTPRKKDPLHPLDDREREVLERLSLAQSEPASHRMKGNLSQPLDQTTELAHDIT